MKYERSTSLFILHRSYLILHSPPVTFVFSLVSTALFTKIHFRMSNLLDSVKTYITPELVRQAANALGELFLPLEGLVDVGAERTRLTKELEKIRAEIGKVEAKLANPAFTQKVPASVLAEHQQRLLDWQGKEKQMLAGLDNLPS